jgi:hypothetical protein
MRHILIVTAIWALLIGSSWTNEAVAGHGTHRGRAAYREAQTYPWHGEYYDTAWGMPVAVVVPPTAEAQTHLGWGVGATRVTPIQHQFERGYPGPGIYNRAWFRPTPAWPSSTDQLGDYYIRGPW